jgi:hypothetical protein
LAFDGKLTAFRAAFACSINKYHNYSKYKLSNPIKPKMKLESIVRMCGLFEETRKPEGPFSCLLNRPPVLAGFATLLFANTALPALTTRNTITAASTSLADVAAAVASAHDGDIVVLPAGDSTWTSELTITKAITLKGQGTSRTFIRRDGNLLSLSPANDLKMRVTGIYFDCGPFYQASDRWAIYIGATISNLRIDHCYFRGGSRTVFIDYKAYGVIDHCTFLNSDTCLGVDDAGSDGGNTSWSNPIQPATTNTMVVETCTFLYDAGVTADPNETLYSQNGGRCCFRYNTIDATAMPAAHPYVALNAEGYDPGWGHGTRFWEIYNNTFHCKYTYRFAFLRGGTHICYDNTFIEDNNDGPDGIDLTNEGVNQGGSATTQDDITNSCFWANTLNGSAINPVVDPAAAPYAVLNRDYFNSSLPLSNGSLLVAINHPYTPLVYPHPRVIEEDGISNQ